MKKILNIILIFILLVISFIFAILKLNNFSLAFTILASILIFFYAKKVNNNYFNILTIFSGFHFLYGVSGPISLLWGNGLKKIYGNIFNLSSYLVAYSLATTGLFLGIVILTEFFTKEKNKNKIIKKTLENRHKNFFLMSSFFIAFSTSFGEFINFIRVGGISTLLKGKAVYQALSGDLIFTIPTSPLAIVALALAGVSFVMYKQENKKISKKSILIFIILLMPYLFLKFILGQRGFLLSYLVMFFIIFSYMYPIKKITKKIVLVLVLGYFSMAILLVTRPVIKYLFTDFSYFTEQVFDKKKIIVALNPGTNEFGCTFGNFNMLYTSNDYDFLYGKSYLNALTFSIPSYLYPGKKPQSITYQFRDTYFPKEQERSRIAGTAFSSILEAYWNFGFVGIFIVYFLFGILLIAIEKLLVRKNEFYLLFYFALAPTFITFHRSDMGDVINAIFLKSLVIVFVYLLYQIFKNENNAIHKFIKKLFFKIINCKIFNFISDEMYLNLKYALNFEKKLDLSEPKTFNEKLQWLKINNRNSLYTDMVDKYNVRKIVEEKIGEKYLTNLFGVYNNFNEIDFDFLPKEFVIKCTHDSGGLIICKDKSTLDMKYARKKINDSLRNNFFYGSREWPYKNVIPKIIVEQYLGDNLIDYRFYCFNGKIKLIYQYVNESSLDGTKPEPKYCNIYDENWNLLPIRQAYPASTKKYKAPKKLDEMKKIAEKLAINIPFIRVDFYIVNEKVYFSELTFFPGAGFSKFYPKEKDMEIGTWLKLPNKEKCDKNEK